ncbi:MAG: TonB C-terminal domain-containing protein [Desulfobacterales bacterium]|nr:TonB C-terminal domain-containing protein [Desulfobacterales bacterium]
MIDQWKTSLPLAIGLHFLILAAAMVLPSVLERHPVLPEVYTVDLFTVTELTPPAPAPARPAPAGPKVIEPPAAPEKIPVKAPASPPAATPVSTAPAPAKAISLAPRRQKTKIRKKTAPAVNRAVEQGKLSRALQKLQTRINEKEAQRKLDRLEQEAVDKIRAAYAGEAAVEATVTAPVAPTVDTGSKHTETRATTGTDTTPANSGGVVTSDAITQYKTTVEGKIKAHWSLPDLQDWDKSLKAILVITVRRDGVVTKTFFDQKSKNVQFNQSVLKAVREAAPLPPLPPELEENQQDLELRFRMEELL